MTIWPNCMLTAWAGILTQAHRFLARHANHISTEVDDVKIYSKENIYLRVVCIQKTLRKF